MNARPSTGRLTSVIGAAALALGLGAISAVLPAVTPAAHAQAPFASGQSTAGPVFAEAAAGCTVSDATLTWGVLERWRTYITGTIGNGDWTLSDGAEYETPAFRWSGGAGELADDGTGEISLTGGVLFSGHDGLLQLTVANPVVELVSPSEGYLLLDLSSTKPSGEPDVSMLGVRAVKIDLDGAISADGTTLEVTEAPGRLTSEGASAFGGFYSSGEEVDPISLTASAPGCALELGAASEESDVASPESEPQVQPVAVAEAPQLPWLPIGIGALALIVIGVAVGMLLSGRKPAVARGTDGDAGTAGSGADSEDPTATNT